MKAKLIKTPENLYKLKFNNNNDMLLCATALLSSKNCDEIFGVVDVEKLAEQEFDRPYIVDMGTNITPAYQDGFKIGFNKAMELNGGKLFTIDDMHEALHLMNNTPRVPIEGEALDIVRKTTEIREMIIDKILNDKQPTEIEVEVEMEVADLSFYENGNRYPIEANLPERFKYKPKLDSEGNLILKKI
jgi:hypothetical protein